MAGVSTYTEEVGDQICESIASGNSLVTTLREDPELPTYTTIMKWLGQHATFAEKYALARGHQADHDADKIGDIAEKVLDGKVDANAARVAIDAYKWSAAQRKPKKYGPKVAIGGTDDLPAIKTQRELDVSNLSLEELEVLGNALQKSMQTNGDD